LISQLEWRKLKLGDYLKTYNFGVGKVIKKELRCFMLEGFTRDSRAKSDDEGGHCSWFDWAEIDKIATKDEWLKQNNYVH
jgi:hypothetical protein